MLSTIVEQVEPSKALLIVKIFLAIMVSLVKALIAGGVLLGWRQKLLETGKIGYSKINNARVLVTVELIVIATSVALIGFPMNIILIIGSIILIVPSIMFIWTAHKMGLLDEQEVE